MALLVHGLIQKARLDAERLKGYRIERLGSLYAVQRWVPAAKDWHDVCRLPSREMCEEHLVAKLPVPEGGGGGLDVRKTPG